MAFVTSLSIFLNIISCLIAGGAPPFFFFFFFFFFYAFHLPFNRLFAAFQCVFIAFLCAAFP